MDPHSSVLSCLRTIMCLLWLVFLICKKEWHSNNPQGVGSGEEDPSENLPSVPLAAGGPSRSALPSVMSPDSSAGSELWPCSQSTLCPCGAHLEFEEAECWLPHRGRGTSPGVLRGVAISTSLFCFPGDRVAHYSVRERERVCVS